MRRLLHAVLALSLLSPGLALAQPYRPEGQPPGHGPGDQGSHDNYGHGDHGPQDNYGHGDHGPQDHYGHGANDHGGYEHGHGGPDHAGPPPREAMHRNHEWRRGERFDGHRYVLDWRRHNLRRPPEGYEWVHVGSQYVMIAIASGVIADVLMNTR